jgi:sugar lactone lactonase YvrE
VRNKTPLTSLVGMALLAATSLAGAAANPTHVTYTTASVASGFRTASGLAVDASGNVYIVDAQEGQVWKETLANGAYTQTLFTTAATGANWIAIDAQGNLYITDGPSKNIYKETLGPNGYIESTVSGTNFTDPFAIAVDTVGNLYVTDAQANTLVKETLSGGTYTQSVITGGLNNAWEVAVDSSGNVYVADDGNNRVIKETFAQGSYTQSTIGTGLSGPYGVAVGPSGIVYIADSYNSRSLTETPNGGTYVQAVFAGTPNAEPESIFVSATGNFYYVSTFNGVFEAIPNELAEAVSTNFGSVTLAGTPATQSVTFSFDVGGTLAASPYYVSTQGDAQLDFVAASTQANDACVTGKTYSPGDMCTVSVSFLPTSPGWRYGAVSLFGPTGNSIGTAYLQGNGTAPQVSFSPGTFYTSVVASNRTTGLAIDSAKNAVFEDVAAATYIGSYATPGVTSSLAGTEILTSGNFEGLGLDGAGNLFIVGGFNTGTSVTEQTLAPSAPVGFSRYADVGTTFTGFNEPNAAVIDGSGNVIIADYATTTAYVETFANGGYNQAPLGNGLNSPTDLAIDGNGAVYILDQGNNRIVKETPSGGSYTQSVIMTGLTQPQTAVAVDGLGNLYIPNGTTVLKETLTNGTYTASTIPLNNGDFPPYVNGTILVDAGGNILVMQVDNSYGTNTVSELDVSDAPTLSFATTAVGSTSSDSPQKLSIVNNGNSTLTFSAPPTTVSAVVSAGFTLGSTTTCPLLPGSTASVTLAPGASCDLYINFVPTTAGNIQGTLTVTDNSLNVAGTQQIIHLNGIATGSGGTTPPPPPPPATPTATLTPGSGAFGSTPVGATSAAQTFTLTSTGSVALTIASVTLSGTSATDFAIASNACGTTLAAGASCAINVTYTPTAAGASSAVLSVADNAGDSPQTASLSGTGTPDDFGVTATPPSQSVAAGSSASYSVNVASVTGDFSGAVTLSASGLPSGATVSFSPTAVTPGTAGAGSTMTIQTAAAVASNAKPGSIWPLGAPVLAVIFCVPVVTRRRTIPRLRSLLALTALTAALSGCGGGFALPEGQTTQSKVYTVTITGSSGSLQHSTTVQLTVQ